MHDVHVIDPVTRIEGHATITVRLDDAGRVADTRFSVTELRGFEELCRGRPVWEMPGLTARTCGICPVSHLIASSKAADAILAVAVPPAAVALRRLANLGQIVQSHALSFFHLSAPDLLLGMDADPAHRNLFGLARAEPELARRGVRLRQFGQEVVAAVTGRRVHGTGIVPGGVAAPLAAEDRDRLAAWLDEAHATAADTLALFERLLDRFPREVAAFGAFPGLFLAHVGPDGRWEHYDGHLRVLDADGTPDGTVVADGLDPAGYRAFLGEAADPHSYLKAPYWRARVPDADPAGNGESEAGGNGDGGDLDRAALAAGAYRVGPLARLNVCSGFGTPDADAALAAFRERAGGVATSSFLYHHARLVEVLACVERIADLLADPLLADPHVRADAGVNRRRGVGASEAPRGTLLHDYEVDEHGVVTSVNMIIATGHNALAMDRTVHQIAEAFVDPAAVLAARADGGEGTAGNGTAGNGAAGIPEGVLNRLEAGIRAFDPCLSCSTHALGAMPLRVRVVDAAGAVRAEARRG